MERDKPDKPVILPFRPGVPEHKCNGYCHPQSGEFPEAHTMYRSLDVDPKTGRTTIKNLNNQNRS